MRVWRNGIEQMRSVVQAECFRIGFGWLLLLVQSAHFAMQRKTFGSQ